MENRMIPRKLGKGGIRRARPVFVPLFSLRDIAGLYALTGSRFIPIKA